MILLMALPPPPPTPITCSRSSSRGTDAAVGLLLGSVWPGVPCQGVAHSQGLFVTATDLDGDTANVMLGLCRGDNEVAGCATALGLGPGQGCGAQVLLTHAQRHTMAAPLAGSGRPVHAGGER
jgi:hypothetical protein